MPAVLSQVKKDGEAFAEFTRHLASMITLMKECRLDGHRSAHLPVGIKRCGKLEERAALEHIPLRVRVLRWQAGRLPGLSRRRLDQQGCLRACSSRKKKAS